MRAEDGRDAAADDNPTDEPGLGAVQVDDVGLDLGDDRAEAGGLGEEPDAGAPLGAPVDDGGPVPGGQCPESAARTGYGYARSVPDLMRNVVSDTMRKSGIYGMGYVKDRNRRHGR
jgi:hypothetical protein